MGNPRNRILNATIAAGLALGFFSCRTSPTGPHITSNIQLSTDYVTCTEVWLKVAFSGQRTAISNSEFKITRDGDTVLTGTLAGTDTVVIDTTTQPERTYTYKAFYLSNSQVSDTSLPLQVTTLDTTSNNFTWQTYTFGGNAGSAVFNDVAIINDTDIWAVGDVPLKDSSANGYSVYNLVGWDGNQWAVYAVRSYVFCGQPAMNSSYGSAISLWNPNDIWIATNGEIVRWNGTSQSVPMCVETPAGFDIYKIWGSDSNHVFAVGRAGGLAQYDGQAWRTFSSGTTLDIRDVWGVSDSTTGEQDILAVASDEFTNNGVAVLQLSGTQATLLQTSGLPTTSIVGVWSANGKEWYVCGDGLYMTRDLNQPWQRITDVPSIFLEAIRGTGPNDIFAVGNGAVLHFDGSRWVDLRSEISAPSLLLYALAVKGNTIAAVGTSTAGGYVAGSAIILVGKRN